MRTRILPASAVGLVVCLTGGCGGCGGSSGPTGEPSAGPGGPGALPAQPAGATGMAMSGPRRYLALGDSYTIGEGVPPLDRWPRQLGLALLPKGYSIDTMIVAKSGWTTRDLLDGMAADTLYAGYDLVTLQIGVNNQYQHRPLEDYRKEFVELLKKATELANNRADRVIVVSIPDYGPTPFAQGRSLDAAKVAAEIDQFNEVNKEEARKAGARYVDVTAESRKRAGDPAMLVGDGLHPSAAQYKAWVDAVLPEAEAALEGKKR